MQNGGKANDRQNRPVLRNASVNEFTKTAIDVAGASVHEAVYGLYETGLRTQLLR